jgi:trehalose 6-phosphate phosphatase
MGRHLRPPRPGAPALPSPATDQGRAGLDALLAHPRRAVVVLDFDGTLSPIVPDPAQARAHPGAVPALAALAPRVGSVVVLTGRPAATAVEYGGFAGVTGLDRLTVLGHYGAERWEAATGHLESPGDHPGVAAARAELPEVLADAPDGTWIEDKGGRAFAVHTRRTADPRAAFDALRGPLRDLADRHGLLLEPGSMVLELRPPGVDKGAALTEHLRAADPSAVLYAGDDLGDLAAYDAVDRFRAEGVPGLLVASAATDVPALTARADLTLAGPPAVVDFLAALATALTV